MTTRSAKYYQLQNYLQSFFLLFAMLALLAFIGALVAGKEGALWATAMVLILVMIGPRLSPFFILRLYQAKLVHPSHAPHLYSIVNELAHRAEIDYSPTIFYIPSQVINAFTIGMKKDTCIVISDAMLRTLNEREITGVLAHEVSHIRNHDLFVMMIADVLSRLTSILALLGYLLILVYLPALLIYEQSIPWLLLLILIFAPNLSAFLQLALSRTREYNADLVAAELTADPLGLASALKKIDYYQHGWFERIFWPARRVPEPSMLRTHPTMKNRIKRLIDIAQDYAQTGQYFSSHYSNHWLKPTSLKKPGKRISGLWY